MKFSGLKRLTWCKKAEEGEVRKNKMFVLRKRQVVAVSLMILIGIAGYLNWTFRNDAVDPDVAVMYQEASKKIGEAQMVNGDGTQEKEEKTDKADASSEENKGKNDTITQSNDNYFAKAKLEREVKRSESMEMLTQLISTQGTDKDAKTNAENQIHRMAEYTEKETAMENMIRAKGFHEVVVFMSEDMVSVAVESEGLNEVDAAQIQDIVTNTCGYSADKIKIVEIKAQ